VAGYRGAVSSLREQASQQPPIPFVNVSFRLSRPMDMLKNFPTLPILVNVILPFIFPSILMSKSNLLPKDISLELVGHQCFTSVISRW
jgi:hypothetical protein